jgi:hypothetical protein
MVISHGFLFPMVFPRVTLDIYFLHGKNQDYFKNVLHGSNLLHGVFCLNPNIYHVHSHSFSILPVKLETI